MGDLQNRTDYKHATVQLLSPGADRNVPGKAIDWIIERCHEIGVTHDPTKCWIPPNDQQGHFCKIRGEADQLSAIASSIAKTIGWEVLANPFDIYYTDIDPTQSEYMIYKAVLIQESLQSNDLKFIFNKKYLELLRQTSRLVEQAGRVHAYVLLSQFGPIQ